MRRAWEVTEEELATLSKEDRVRLTDYYELANVPSVGCRYYRDLAPVRKILLGFDEKKVQNG